MDALAKRGMMPLPRCQEHARLVGASASTHHCSARVTSMMAWKIFGSGCGLRLRAAADISIPSIRIDVAIILP
jgi:hypothetical protein